MEKEKAALQIISRHGVLFEEWVKVKVLISSDVKEHDEVKEALKVLKESVLDSRTKVAIYRNCCTDYYLDDNGVLMVKPDVSPVLFVSEGLA